MRGLCRVLVVLRLFYYSKEKETQCDHYNVKRNIQASILIPDVLLSLSLAFSHSISVSVSFGAQDLKHKQQKQILCPVDTRTQTHTPLHTCIFFVITLPSI